MKRITLGIFFLSLCMVGMGEERVSVRRFPTPRWVKICNSSQKWYHNKTSALSSYLRDNLDALYL